MSKVLEFILFADDTNIFFSHTGSIMLSGTFRLTISTTLSNYKNTIFEFPISDISRALALRVGFM